MPQQPVQHYFAYGSNMNVARVRERQLPFTMASPAALSGYELLFDKVARDHAGRGHANIAPRPGSIVEGVLYQLVHHTDIRIMDRFEQTPHNYSREIVAVETADGPVWSWTYMANPAVRQSGCKPERVYLEHLLAGAPFLSATYLSKLLAIEVVNA
jgi:gamma-glutamylcyclotransferase (GGCT)/AIG2-like uncharacterized protein YtfP